MSAVAAAEIGSVEWASYEAHYGDGSGIGEALRDLLDSTDFDSAADAWDRLEDHVFSQGTIYSVAEPTVSVLLAALTEEQPAWRAGRIVDLLFFVVDGASVADLMLQERCRARAREGFWLLVSYALQHDGWARENVIEVLEVVAPERIAGLRDALSE